MEARHSGRAAMPRRQRKRFVIAFAWAMAATTGHDCATAADLKPALRQASTQFDWTGFYVGGHVGYSRGSAEVTVTDPDPKAPRTIAGFGDSALAERTSAGLVPR